MTYLFVSHDLGVVRHLCNRVLVMYLGQMVELAPVEKLYENQTHPYTEALLSAIPRLAVVRKRERIRLTGDLPSPSNPPTARFIPVVPSQKIIAQQKNRGGVKLMTAILSPAMKGKYER